MISDNLLNTLKMIPLAQICKDLGLEIVSNKVKCVDITHNDTNPSLALLPDNNVFCFGCNFKGSTIDLWGAKKGIQVTLEHSAFYLAAKDMLAYYGLSDASEPSTLFSDYSAPKNKQKAKTTKAVGAIDSATYKLFEYLAKSSRDIDSNAQRELVMLYLESRGFDLGSLKEAAKAFPFFIAPALSPDFQAQIRQHKAQFQAVGLTQPTEKSPCFCTFHYHPLVFTYLVNGKIAGFEGRRIDNENTAQRPKYKWIGNNKPIYNSDALLDTSKTELVVSEGVLDLITYYCYYCENRDNVAFVSTAGNLNKLPILPAHIKEVLIITDNNGSGIGKESAFRLAQKIVANGSVKVSYLDTLDCKDLNKLHVSKPRIAPLILPYNPALIDSKPIKPQIALENRHYEAIKGRITYFERMDIERSEKHFLPALSEIIGCNKEKAKVIWGTVISEGYIVQANGQWELRDKKAATKQKELVTLQPALLAEVPVVKCLELPKKRNLPLCFMPYANLKRTVLRPYKGFISHFAVLIYGKKGIGYTFARANLEGLSFYLREKQTKVLSG